MAPMLNPNVHANVVNNPYQIIYLYLRDYYGHQSWWPAEDQFEIMIGAILTQNTAWTNVEKAITNLKQNNRCDAESLAAMEHQTLAKMIRSSGYYNQKAERLRLFAEWYLKQGGALALARRPLKMLRKELLALKGIGDETADDMLLYAFDQPSFVIDTYTRRIFSRMGLVKEKGRYEELQQQFHDHLESDTELFQQYHALIVSHAKRHCLKTPDCIHCPLTTDCIFYEPQP